MPAASSRPSRLRSGSAKQVVLITLACSFVLGAFYALSQLGPDSYSVGSRKEPVSREQEEKLRSAAESAEARWLDLKRARARDKTPFSEDDLRVIGEAAVARMQYEAAVNVAAPLYPALRKELHDRSGEQLRAKSVAVEGRAVIAEREQKHALAQSLYREAADIEIRLAAEFPESSFKNMQRLVFLESRMRLMQAKPIWENSLAQEKASADALAKGDLPRAISLASSAFEANLRLEREFRGLTPADSYRSRTLGRKLATLRSLSVRDRALAALDRAEKAAASRDFSELPALRKAVEDAAREIADKYPDSEYATPASLAALVRRAQNAASAPDAEAVERAILTLDNAIRSGDTAAPGLIEDLGRSVLRVRSLYPESDRIGKPIADRVDFLFLHRTEVALIASSVNAALRPMPGRPDLLVLRTETPQKLYSLIMGENPSAAPGDLRPVESLSRNEARLFCQRLGWLIARPVRLLDEGEFRALVGQPDPAKLAPFVRSIDNSDGSSAPVPAAKPDSADIADLLGNVAEWLESPVGAKPDEALVAGGDAESTLAQLARVPVLRKIASERSRFVGFRFLVEKHDSPR